MEQGFIQILKTIIKEQGKDIFNEASKCKAILSDYTKGEYKKESRLLLQAIEAKIPKAINAAQEIDLCRKQALKRLDEDFDMKQETAEDLTDTLIHVLKGVPFPKRESASQKEKEDITNQKKDSAQTAPDDQYFLSVNGKNTGPFDTETMKTKIKKGEIKRETYVWKEGMAEWVQAVTVKELSGFLPPSAPPPPRPAPITPVQGTVVKPAPSQSSSSVKTGDIIKFGNYDWRVLDVQGDKALIITKDIIKNCKYHSEYKGTTWEACTLRNYLNGEFYNKFTSEQQKRIVETRITNNDNLWYGTAGGNDTTDKIFLLSIEEADKYFGNSGDYHNKRRIDIFTGVESNIAGGFISNIHNNSRIAAFENKNYTWWLRSPGIYDDNQAGVCANGAIDVVGDKNFFDRGVRPALWLKI